MTELAIYNSQGKRFDTEQPEISTRIEEFFFGGVRLYIDVGREIELIAFFRARESKASRAEQYYAIYRTDSLHQLFQRFTTALNEEMKEAHGMMVQTTSEDVQLFAGLATEYAAPGSPSTHRQISTLLSEGKQLQFGVSDTDEALGLFQKYLDGPAKRLAIAEDASNKELADCDFVIELGSYNGLEPLGSTENYLAKKQQRSGSSRPRTADSPPNNTSLAKAKRIGMPIVVAIGTFVLLSVLLVLAVNGAALANIGIPGTLESLVFV